MARANHLTLLAAATLSLALASGVGSAQTAAESDAEGDAATAEQETAGEPAAEPAEPVAEDAAEAPAKPAADAEAAAEVPETATEERETAAEEADAAADASADTVVAVIDGKELTLGELIALRSGLPQQYQALPDEVLMQGLTEQMVDQTLLAQAARDAGLADRTDVALSLKNQERAVLADAYLRAEMAERVTADALRQAYQEQYVEAEPVDEIRAAHILVETEEQAQDLMTRLEEGAEFAKLAEEYGTDSTAARGGDLGWFAKGDMVPSFGDAAFALEPGELGGPVQSPFGWHVIRVDERRTRPVPEFEEVQQSLLEQVTQEAQAAIVEELRSAADIQIQDPPPPASIRNDELIGAEESP